MIRRPAAPSRRFWIFAACLLLALSALPSHAHAQLTLTSFDIGASPNPVPDDGSTIFSAYVAGISQTPSGLVTFYISASTASCTGVTDGNQIGSGSINAETGSTTVAYTAYTPGIIPICAQYAGDDTYASDTAGVYLLTVEQPPTFTVNVVGAAEAQTPVNFAFNLSVPNGQPLPTGTVTLYDEYTGNSDGTVNINPDGSIPNIDGITLGDGYYEAEYSGDGNYTAQYFYGDVFQEYGLTAIVPDLIAAGSGDTTITLDGLNFDGSSVAELNINTAVIPLSTTFNGNPNQLQATIPQAYLANPGSLSIYVYTSDTNYSTNNVTVLVNSPNSDAITVSSSQQTFAYGSQVSTTLGSTVTPTASAPVGGVPAGQVSYILTGPGVNQSIASSQLYQNTNDPGSYVSTPPAALDAGSAKILSADLNNDGNFDIVSLPGYYPGDGGDGPYLQVMLSTGVDSFATEQEVYVGCTPQDFALGDINNDGFTDIIVACQNPDSGGGFPVAEYVLGNGDGTFQAPVQFASNAIVGLITSPTQVAVGDFNGDGVLDVALIDGVNGNVQVLFSDNPFDGGYNASSQNSFDTSQGEVISAGAADFNQDGYSDIALEEYNYDGDNGAVLVLTSNGYGGFNSNSSTEQDFSATTNEINSMVITDVNGDNYPDIAIAEPGNVNCDCDSSDSGQVIVFENAEYGPGNYGTLNPGYSIAAYQATDVTGVPFPATGAPSGTPAVAPGWNLLYAGENYDSTQILVTPLQRLGAGNWQTGTTISTSEVIPYCDCGSSTFPSYLTASDANADGYLDFTLYGQDGDSNNQLETVDWSNAAATSLSTLPPVISPGNYTLAASYPGTPLFAGGGSTTIPITIDPGQPTGAITGPSPASASAGTTVTLTATITPVSGGALPIGTVTFFNNGSQIGSPVGIPLGTNSASLTTTLPIGLDTITASYSGDGNYSLLTTSQITSYQIQINGLTLSLGLTSSTGNTTAGAMVTFTATATGASLPSPEPVTLTGLPTAVTVSPIMTNGVATYSYGQFPPGNYNIQASYAGDGSYLPQTSNIVTLQVGDTPITVTAAPSANPVTYPTPINLLATVSGNGFGIPTGTVVFDLGPSGNQSDLGRGLFSLVNGSSGLNLIGTYGGNADAALNDIATVSGDFNHDGIPDLAVLQQNSNVTTLQIFIGNGDGTFQAPVTYGSAQSVAANSATLAAADFNGDGYTDLAIGTSDGAILIFLATGDSAGDLSYSQGLTGNAEAGIAAGNFSPGNIPGLAVAGYSTVEVFTQSAPGTFNASPYYTYSTDGPQYAGITVADFNNDSAPDFAATDSNNNNVAVFLNQPSNNTFTVTTYPVGASAGAIASGDINGDTFPDLAVVSPTDSTVAVLINNQAGGFNAPTTYGVAGQPTSVTMADFNKDGYADIAVAGTQTGVGGGTSILLGSSTGAISGEALLSGAYGSSIVSADFNSDTNPDLAVGYNGVTTFLDQAGQFSLPTVFLPAGTDTVTANYTPTEGSVWAGGSTYFVETVNQATPSISWPTPSPITYGTALSSTQLDATSPTAGSFTYIPAAGAVLDAGPQILTANFIPTDTTDYQAISAQVTLTVNQAVPSVSWSNPAPITYGTALSGIQLDATSPIQGSFSYTPALGTVLGAGTQTLSVTFTPTDSTDYQAVTTSVSLVVNKATTTVTWNEPAAITYPAALTGTQLDASASIQGTFNYTPGTGTVLQAGSHTLSVTFTPSDSTDYQSVTTTTSILVNKGTASITWNNPSAITYGTALSATQLNATSAVQGTFSYSPAAGTILPAGTQPLNVTFTPADTTDYQASNASVTIVVNKATTSITWSNPAAITYGTALSTTQLDAITSVPGTLMYTPAAGTVLQAGTRTLTVNFTPTDANDYQTSTTSVSILVNQATTSVTWANPASITYGTALSGTQLNATASVAGTFNYSPVSGTVLAAGTHTLNVTFTPTDAVDYQTSTGSATIIVKPSASSINWNNPAAITYGTALSATQLNATSAIQGGFVYSPAAGTVLGAGTQTLNVTFTPTDTTDYQTSTASVTILVKQATSSVTWANPTAITYGTALSGTQLNATASVPGAFAYNPIAGTVLTAGTHTLNVTFTPTDNTDYKTSTGSTTIVVKKATTSITWANPGAIAYGTALSATQLDATAGVPGTYVYTPVAGTVLNAGTHTLNVAFTPTDTTDYQTSTGSATIVVNKATTSVTWTNPAAITYGTALTATQLNATASVPGRFAYTPAAGTVLTGGQHTLNVTFTPTDAAEYQTSTGSVTIVVNEATTRVTWARPAAITYGTALSGAQLNATASQPGTFAYTPSAGTVLTAGTQTLNVTFTPTDSTDYQVATASVSIVVKPAASSITWSKPAAITYGTALTSTQLDATSTISGNFTYNPSAGTILTAGTHTLSVSFAPTDTTDYQISTDTVTIVVNKATTTVNWANPAAITYGTALGAAQLDATSAVAGTFAYTPAAGTVLKAGTNSLSVSFTPTDTTDYLPSTGSASILVNKATPALVWNTPQPIYAGTALSATQLDATAAPAGGTFTYTPPLGTILPIGNQTLSVSYTPTDTTDYTTASTTVTLVVGPDLVLSSIAPSTGTLEQAATTITVTGVAFSESSTVQLNGATIASHFVSSTQMTAVIPASFFKQIQTGLVTVTSNGVTTPGLTFTVSATTVQATLSGPSTAQPGEQPIINFTLSQGYSLPLQGTFTLTVVPAVSGQPVDPAVQFSTGGTTLNFTIPAGTTTTPTVQLQTGTLAATITVTLTLTADGQNVTPDNIAPVVITVPAVSPVISSVKLTRNGDSITVTVDGFSSTRDMTSAIFNFTPASGATLSDSQVTVDVSNAFTTWYNNSDSDQYGSAFSYTQTFTLSNSADNIQSVSVTLTNSVGTSTPASAN
jgi:hypothetical protein